LDEKIDENQIKIRKVEEFLNKFKIDDLRNKETSFKQFESDYNAINKLLEKRTETHDTLSHKIDLLKQVPCGPEFSHCKFIKGAYEAQEEIKLLDIVIENIKKSSSESLEQMKSLDGDKLNDQLKKYNTLIDKKSGFSNELEFNKLQLVNKRSNLVLLENDLEKILKSEELFQENKESIEKYHSISKLIIETKTALKELHNTNLSVEKEILELYKNLGSLEQKHNVIETEKQTLDKLQEEYSILDLFLKCMHSNGISYEIIKNSLPIINKEIEKNLSTIVDFNVYFQNEENRLELYIKKPNQVEPLPIEMASVAQKMLAAMAIRLAFIHISSLPKSDVFILDEPGTALDSENMEGFIQLLDIIKAQFKCVFLISHLDALKETADSIITIEQKPSGAFVSV
jgi:DNA repair exonuclease SbcCD ATPase subunit